MEIIINDHKELYTIQKAFSEMCPYLKLEFFSKAHKPGAPSPKKLIKASNKTIGECRTRHTNGTITITPQIRIIELEETFREIFGLSVQVFRKSGDSWLEVTHNVNETLEEQNKVGEESTHPEVPIIL